MTIHDPRFAGWLDLIAQDDPPPDPEAIARRQERTELMRQAQQRIIDLHEQGIRIAHPTDLEGARAFVMANPPLRRPIGTGEPA